MNLMIFGLLVTLPASAEINSLSHRGSVCVCVTHVRMNLAGL